MIRGILAALAVLALSAGWAQAAPPPELTPQEKAELARLVKLRDSLHPLQGSVALPEAKAHLNLGAGYYFLGPADAKRVLTEGWGNPPEAAEGVLGLVFPRDEDFISSAWGAVVTYEKTDYVSDTDAASTDYDQLLSDMREGEADGNAAREKAGFTPIHIVGWAQAPTYDAARHDLIWARELQFGTEPDHTLNYDVRHLGRHGVLSLNMVSTMSDLAAVRTGAHDLARTAEFDAGARYADFQKGDAVAGYGLAGLVAAGAGLAVAKKIGFLGVILLFAKKFLAIFAVAGAALVGWFRKTLGVKAKAARAPAADPAPADEAPPPV